MGISGNGGIDVMMWRAKVTCQFQGRIVEKGEIIESPKRPNSHFEKMEEVSSYDTNLNENIPSGGQPSNSSSEGGNENDTGGQTALNLTPESSGNNQESSKITPEGNQLEEYNRLVDILQANKYSLSDLPDKKTATITKFLQEKGLL